jgi:hypothetical protein
MGAPFLFPWKHSPPMQSRGAERLGFRALGWVGTSTDSQPSGAAVSVTLPIARSFVLMQF